MLIKFGSLELDEPHFELRRDGQPVAVQPKVLDLIIYLARHRDRMVSKDELFRVVWDGVTVTEAALSQAVSQARRVLDDSSTDQQVIRTVHGKGFRFVADVREISKSALETDVPSVRSQRLLEATSGSLDLDTVEEVSRRSSELHAIPHLFVALHCDEPELGSARFSLHEVDEVTILRGTERTGRRETSDVTRRLEISLPGHAVSREHARLTCTREGWFVLDNASKNGTYVNGARIERQRLAHGDIIECGRTLLVFEEHVTPAGIAPDSDSRDFPEGGVVGSLLPVLQAKRHVLKRVARTNLPVLIQGEVGVGKASVARIFHDYSERKGRFVSVDSGALAQDGAIAQLFGSSAGAESKDIGLVRSADEGTLCLQHVERLPPAAQASLVHVLDEGVIMHAESPTPVRVNVRFVATSSVSLDQMAQQGNFDRELLVRLGGFRLEVPPLRARRGELGWVIACLADLTTSKVRFSAASGLLLINHAWPHNWLELRQCLVGAAALARDGTVDLEHLPARLVEDAGRQNPRAT